jgi:hypothetical protein
MTENFDESIITGTRAISGSDEIEKRRHRFFGIEQALVHIDVDDLRAVLDLIARYRERRSKVTAGDQFAKARRAGHVGAFADIYERNC